VRTLLVLALLLACGGPEGREIYITEEPEAPEAPPACVFAGLYEVAVTPNMPGCTDGSIVVVGSDFQNAGACVFDERSTNGAVLASFECEPGSPVLRCTGSTIDTSNGCTWDTTLRRL
jgi:hypothetical protein